MDNLLKARKKDITIFNLCSNIRKQHKKYEQLMMRLWRLDPTRHYELRSEINERRPE